MPEGYIAVAVEDPTEINPRLEIKQCIQMLEDVISKQNFRENRVYVGGMFSCLLLLVGTLAAYFYTNRQQTIFENDDNQWQLEKENTAQAVENWWDLCTRVRVEKANWVNEQITSLITPMKQQLAIYINNATEIYTKYFYDFIPGSVPATSCPEVDKTNVANSSYCADLASAYRTISELEHSLHQQMDSVRDNMERIADSMANFTVPEKPSFNQPEPQESYDYVLADVSSKIAMGVIGFCIIAIVGCCIDNALTRKSYDLNENLTEKENKQLTDLCEKYKINAELPLKQLIQAFKDVENKIGSRHAFLSMKDKKYKKDAPNLYSFFKADDNYQLTKKILDYANLLPPPPALKK